MTRYTPPPGETFDERWPDEAAEREWLAGPWVPVVLGGFGGLFGVPLMLAALVRGQTVGTLAVLFIVLGLATLGMVRGRGGARRLSGRVWKLVAWSILAAVLGLLLGIVADTLCQDLCAPGPIRYFDRPVATVAVFGGSVLGSIAIAIGVDRAARRLAGMR
jgi:hypothetical protein